MVWIGSASRIGKPMIVHLLKKLTSNWEARCGTNNRIDATFRAESCAANFFEPIFNLQRWEDAEAIKTTTFLAGQNLLSMSTRVLMCAIIIATFVFMDNGLAHLSSADRYQSADDRRAQTKPFRTETESWA